jgi:hypothetical protein
MSELSPLSGVERKSHFSAGKTAFDPKRTSTYWSAVGSGAQNWLPSDLCSLASPHQHSCWLLPGHFLRHLLR